MLTTIAGFAIRFRKWVLVVTLLAAVGAGAFGSTVFGHVKQGGWDDPSSEAFRAGDAIKAEFGEHQPNLLLVVDGKGRSVDDPEVRAHASAVAARLASRDDLADITSYFATGSAALKSKDGTKALILVRITSDHLEDKAASIAREYTTDDGVISTSVGGFGRIYHDITKQVQDDLALAEAISLPLVLVLLVFIFGGLVAAAMPLVLGLLSIAGTFLILRVLTMFTDVSVFAINLTTMLGLGLGIDYSLFVLTRYREEVRKGLSRDDAIVRAVQTGGRTVLFSAMVVGCSLAAMLVFPLFFLRSFGYAGIGVVVMSSIATLVVMPALLSVVGDKIERLTLFRHASPDIDSPFWGRVARVVMRRPAVVMVLTTAVLVTLGLPFARASFGDADDRVLPASAASHQVGDVIRDDFGSRETSALSVIAAGLDGDTNRTSDVSDYASRLSLVPGAARVDSPAGSFIGGQRIDTGSDGGSARTMSTASAALLTVVPSVEPISKDGEQLVKDVRATTAPFETLTTGASAYLVDNQKPLTRNLPWAALIIAISTLVILFLMTGSVVLPLKALVLTVLSLTATFGAMVWVFQDGHLADLLNFTPTGTIDRTNPIVMFCIAFGLSMDYEVFLLSRIKEERDRGLSTADAIAVGLRRTGRLVSAAAMLIGVVFIAFATSRVTFIKLIGVGLALAVVMDATIVRGALVPAFMRLMGEANWWAPKPLMAVHRRFGLKD